MNNINKNDLIKCAKLSVNCVSNDPVDIRCGGPLFLGFDFIVKLEEVKGMKEFILLTLESLNVPLHEMYVSDFLELKLKDIWNKEMIVECIQKDAEYLIREKERDYPIPYRKKKRT